MEQLPGSIETQERSLPLGNKPHLFFFMSRITGMMRYLDLDSPHMRPGQNRAVFGPNGVDLAALDDAVKSPMGSVEVCLEEDGKTSQDSVVDRDAAM